MLSCKTQAMQASGGVTDNGVDKNMFTYLSIFTKSIFRKTEFILRTGPSRRTMSCPALDMTQSQNVTDYLGSGNFNNTVYVCQQAFLCRGPSPDFEIGSPVNSHTWREEEKLKSSRRKLFEDI